MTKLPSNICEYLNKRGITNEVIKHSLITYNNNKITIPVFDRERNLLFSKHRRDPFVDNDTTPKYTYDHGASAALFNIHTVRDIQKPVIITEGELDALCLTSHGLQAISSTGGSTTFLEEWAETLKGYDVIICYDRDPAGIKGMLRVQRMIPWARCIFLPEMGHGKDVTDFVTTKGHVAFMSLPAETWLIPEPDIHISKVKQIKLYNTIADRAFEYQKVHPESQMHTDFIIEQSLKYREDIKSFSKKILKYKKDAGADKIENAKLVPITNFIQFNASGFACCPWHGESTASLKYYPKTNTAFCFGACGHKYDSIDIVRLQQNCTLSEALDYLLKQLK